MKRLCVLVVVSILTSLVVVECHRETEKEAPPSTPAVPGSLPPEFTNMIGVEFGPDNFPEGFEEHTGYVMGFLEGDEYIIDHVSREDRQILWFCKLTGRDAEGRPNLKILDLLLLPPIQAEESLMMGTCKASDKFDPEIIAVVKFGVDEFKSEVRHAWRANRQTQKFLEIPRENVSCMDESYFL